MQKHKEALQACVFIPDHPIKLAWDMLALIQILIHSFILPFFISFSRKYFQYWKIYIIISNSFFLIDILINFNTGFYWRGALITERLLTAKNYLKTLFVPDLLASIPYYFILKLWGITD